MSGPDSWTPTLIWQLFSHPVNYYKWHLFFKCKFGKTQINKHFRDVRAKEKKKKTEIFTPKYIMFNSLNIIITIHFWSKEGSHEWFIIIFSFFFFSMYVTIYILFYTIFCILLVLISVIWPVCWSAVKRSAGNNGCYCFLFFARHQGKLGLIIIPIEAKLFNYSLLRILSMII